MSTIKVNNIESTVGGGVAAKLTSVNGGAIGTKNLVINGDFRISQRHGTAGTASTGGFPVDRFVLAHHDTNENPRGEQSTVAAGTDPYSKGFRNSILITNGNQTSGAGAGDVVVFYTRLEAGDIATSGWNYTDSNSFITLSFWVKSSVAQEFRGRATTDDGTAQNYSFSYTLSANTWTKVTKSFPGNSNLQFDNNNDNGFAIEWTIFRGTNMTSSGATMNAWITQSSSTQAGTDMTSTWYTTNDATFEVTGVQLEVGNVATDFEHRSFGQEMHLCQRYFQRYTHATYRGVAFSGRKSGSGTVIGCVQGMPSMRAAATSSVSNVAGYRLYRFLDGSTASPTAVSVTHEGSSEPYNVLKYLLTTSSFSTGNLIGLYATNTSGSLSLDAEL